MYLCFRLYWSQQNKSDEYHIKPPKGIHDVGPTTQRMERANRRFIGVNHVAGRQRVLFRFARAVLGLYDVVYLFSWLNSHIMSRCKKSGRGHKVKNHHPQ